MGWLLPWLCGGAVWRELDAIVGVGGGVSVFVAWESGGGFLTFIVLDVDVSKHDEGAQEKRLI